MGIVLLDYFPDYSESRYTRLPGVSQARLPALLLCQFYFSINSTTTKETKYQSPFIFSAPMLNS